ncbi:glycosyltransferase 87 family protein [Bradyrhizobium sp. USDA 223]|uniref:glycosyltransferase 87 family protein n=1 Tax=Bradyrhizobium sp. USDA 223 TaxID=3156306 RepID=UPI00384FE753
MSISAADRLRRSWRAKQRGNALAAIAIVVCSMLAGALYTLAMGEDVNWDWQNYHEYNVWAVLNGRYGVDVIPPGFQTYFNPLVYFPVYHFRHVLPAPYGLMIIGAVHGLNLALIWLFARLVLRQAATIASVAAVVVIAASGPMTLSEVGTSFSDVLLALPVIVGCLLILTADRRPTICFLLAGLLIGAAVGLKLTNVVYAIGAAAALLVSARPLRAITLLGIGGIFGAALTGGGWCLITWRDTGNPIFPLFNALFQSSEVADVNLMDAQFMPHGVLDALAYPFYWLIGDHRGAEHPFRDARFAVVMVLLALGLWVRARRKSAILTRGDLQLVVLFAASYLAWLGLFSIQRYVVVLELLCGPLIVLLLARLAGSVGPTWLTTSPRPLAALTLTVAVAIAAWSQPADWWHRPWSDVYRPKIAYELDQPATYFILGKPLAYIAPQLPSQSRFYLLADIAVPIVPGGIFDQRIRAGLKAPLPGGVRELHMRGEPDRSALLGRYELTIDRSRPCVTIEGARPGTVIESCPLIARGSL